MNKRVKNTNKKDAYSSQDLKRYLGALAETHNEHLKGIKEGFVVVNKKLDEHTEMIGTLMEDVSTLKDDVSSLKGDVSDLKQDMQFVKRELKRKVDYDEFLSLVQRVMKLEAKI